MREWGQEQTQLTAGACLLQVHVLEELHLGRNTNGKGNVLKENIMDTCSVSQAHRGPGLEQQWGHSLRCS